MTTATAMERTIEPDVIARARIAKALGDPVRMQILLWCSRGEWAVWELGRHVDHRQQAVSHHLTILKLMGLVGWRRDGKSNLYAATAAGIEALARAGVS